MNYFDVLLVIVFRPSLFYLYWLFDKYKIVNVSECNIKTAVSIESNGTNHLRIADWTPNKCLIEQDRRKDPIAIHPVCGSCDLWCVSQPLSFTCLDRGLSVLEQADALYRKAGPTGNATLTALQLWCEIRTKRSCSLGMRTSPVPQGRHRDSHAVGSTAEFSYLITLHMPSRTNLLILYVRHSKFLRYKGQ